MQFDFQQLRKLIQNPMGFLHRHRIDLQVFPDRLQLPGRHVCGIWDPLARTITLYQVDARSNQQLVETLIHESCHAVCGSHDEKAINSFVATIMDSLTIAEINHCARCLREHVCRNLQPHAITATHEYRHTFFPGGITI